MGLCVLFVSIFLVGCYSLATPQNVRQEGWYLKWDHPDYILASGRTVEFRRHSEQQWWFIPVPPPPVERGRLNLQIEWWRDGQHLFLQDGDLIRISFWEMGLMHSSRSSRWVMITFVMPD